MHRLLFFSLILQFFGCQPPESSISSLDISDNGRYFVTENETPFFWLGDTGWLIFSRLNREEANIYLDDRKAKGFNVIQAMVIHDVFASNFYGDSALIKGNVALPDTTDGVDFSDTLAYDFWDHIDYVIDLAQQKGLYMALVPVWGSNVKSGKVQVGQASKYAKWLSKRYANQPHIIWLNGGDTRGDQNTHIWNEIGRQLKINNPNHLITFHPFGRTQSSMWFHDADWLDFNMFQSGHRRYDQDDTELAYGEDSWKYVRNDYSLIPTKPTLDGEPSYEGIPQGLHDTSQPYWSDSDLRRYAYWSVFEGACGFTYGHSAIMQMHKPNNPKPAYGVRQTWEEALNAPGAQQMIWLKELMTSYSFHELNPDNALVISNGQRYNYQPSLIGKEVALTYTYNGREISIDFNKLRFSSFTASWYNPRNGQKTQIDLYNGDTPTAFDPPGNQANGNDWILVLENSN
ncbi:MAG: glycoside hydrolase family 140 protein [Cyclobacteriaceae bacterium]